MEKQQRKIIKVTHQVFVIYNEYLCGWNHFYIGTL
jgi:hypothetical protein